MNFPADGRVYFIVVRCLHNLYYVHNDTCTNWLTWTKIEIGSGWMGKVVLGKGRRLAVVEAPDALGRLVKTVGAWRTVTTPDGPAFYRETTPHTNEVVLEFPMLEAGSLLAVPLVLGWTPMESQPLAFFSTHVPCAMLPGRAHIMSIQEYVAMRAWMCNSGATVDKWFALEKCKTPSHDVLKAFVHHLPQPCTLVAHFMGRGELDVEYDYAALISTMYGFREHPGMRVLIATDAFGRHVHRLVKSKTEPVYTYDREILLPNPRHREAVWVTDGFCRSAHLEWDLARMGMLPLNPIPGLEEGLKHIYKSCDSEPWSECLIRITKPHSPYLNPPVPRPLLTFLNPYDLSSPQPDTRTLACHWESLNCPKNFPKGFRGLPVIETSERGAVGYSQIYRDGDTILRLLPIKQGNGAAAVAYESI